ncbi:C-type mannose receptor 2-like [Tachysurus ichikawai]
MKAVHAVLLFAALTGAATCLFTRKYSFVTNAKDWNSAMTFCRKHYVDLATINSEISGVKNFSTAKTWIGLRRSSLEANFMWSDGSDVEYTNWKTGEPTNSNIYLCVYLYMYTSFVVENCSKTLPFICYTWMPKIIVPQQKMNWEDALNYCRTYYQDLVSLSTDDDLRAVKTTNQTYQSPSLWTGLRFINGLWFWVNNETLGNLTSMSSCPTRPFQCGALKTEGYILESMNCNEEMNFLCY